MAVIKSQNKALKNSLAILLEFILIKELLLKNLLPFFDFLLFNY